MDKDVDEEKVSTEPKRKKAKLHVEYKEGDLRLLLKQGLNNDKSPFDVLSENGFIDNITTWITEG